ncbi:cation:proton antiporter [Herbaspirillum sp. SJZ107]|uniref:cation:proton antiporter domain-containing protein n=1 Tax=Herbaspirillum sp. SJZ107 TaxID=2572881 RepID=UPI00114DD30F|nr:cation:proton antiporter [Herbaspirillum sp. SJZ107]TQK11289.1 NhaP-type Na+/H+ or K+/H+ antiporter [Herbaspirillum sp. SJZ107]
MNEESGGLPLFLFSPLAIIGAGLLLSQVIGVLLQKRGVPRLYGAVVAGLILGVSGLKVVDGALLTYFQELLNAASALVLFEAGRKTDLAWLWRSRAQGASLALGCVLRGAGTLVLLRVFGLAWAEAAFIAAILVAVNPVVFTSMVADNNASGVATYAAANTVGLSHLVALVALSVSLAWLRSHGAVQEAPFAGQLLLQGGKLLQGAGIALACYAVYTVAARLSSAQAGLRPGILLATLMMDLGLCSVTSSSALLSLLLMGLLLRNAEKRDNVFQAQIKTVQDIGYALLFMMSAALVQFQQLLHWSVLLAALLVFGARIALTRLALVPGQAWSRRKKHAIALAACSLVSFSTLVVDSSISNAAYLSESAHRLMQALLALNVLAAPAVTWAGLRLAGETHEGNEA